MSTSQKEFDDLKVVISRVDDICNFLNNMKKSNRTTKERLDLLESNFKRLEQNKDGTNNQITNRLNNVETTVTENQEKLKIIETGFKKQSIELVKEQDIEQTTKKMLCINAELKQGICDLEMQISNLNKEYEAVKGVIETKK